MLAKNAINYWLFKFGYLGRENIFEYWTENKKELLDRLNYSGEVSSEKNYILEAFEAKVRWQSPVGVLMAEEIRRAIRRKNKNQIFDFSKICVKYGRDIISLKEFTDSYPVGEIREELIDLRGLSVIRSEISEIVFSNVDLSYGCFDSTKFKSIKFDNCKLFQVTFCDSVFEGCSFDSQCLIDSVDFSRAILNCEFEGIINKPVIAPLKWRYLFYVLCTDEHVWPPYTVVESKSFLNAVGTYEMKNVLIKNYDTLNKMLRLKKYFRYIQIKGKKIKKQKIKNQKIKKQK